MSLFFLIPLTFFQWLHSISFILKPYLSLMITWSLNFLSVLGFYLPIEIFSLLFPFQLSVSKSQCFHFNVILAFYPAFIILRCFLSFFYFSSVSWLGLKSPAATEESPTSLRQRLESFSPREFSLQLSLWCPPSVNPPVPLKRLESPSCNSLQG